MGAGAMARPNFERRIHQARPIIIAYDRCQLQHGPVGGLGNGVAAAEAASRAPKASASSSSSERCWDGMK